MHNPLGVDEPAECQVTTITTITKRTKKNENENISIRMMASNILHNV